MVRLLVASIFTSLCVAACGGGGDGPATAPAAKTLKLSFYGQPLVSASPAATAHAAAAASDGAASAPAAASDPAAVTVQTLQDALAARGVTATVIPQVMDGTTLHQIVIGQDNGLPPTPDQFKTDPSEWLVVNFELDDMVSRVDVPAQAAAINQFAQDLAVFAQRAAVSGKRVFAVVPIFTCDAPVGFSASYGLQAALTQAGNNSTLISIGALANNIVTPDHLGADCRTPDAFLQNARTQAVADNLANRFLPPPTGVTQ